MLIYTLQLGLKVMVHNTKIGSAIQLPVIETIQRSLDNNLVFSYKKGVGQMINSFFIMNKNGLSDC